MKKADLYKKKNLDLKKEIIDSIITKMESIKAEQICLHKGINFNYIDDENFEIIKHVSINERVYLDDGNIVKMLPIQNLLTDQLISLWERIEKKQFKIDQFSYDSIFK
jgi:hypothetical protein